MQLINLFRGTARGYLEMSEAHTIVNLTQNHFSMCSSIKTGEAESRNGTFSKNSMEATGQKKQERRHSAELSFLLPVSCLLRAVFRNDQPQPPSPTYCPTETTAPVNRGQQTAKTQVPHVRSQGVPLTHFTANRPMPPIGQVLLWHAKPKF